LFTFNFKKKLESNDSGNEDSDTYEQQAVNNLVLPQNVNQQLNASNNAIILINHNQSEIGDRGGGENSGAWDLTRQVSLNNNNYPTPNYGATSKRNYNQSSFNKM